MSDNDTGTAVVMATLDLAAAIRYSHDLLRKPTSDQHVWLLSEACSDLWRLVSSGLGCESQFPEIPSDYQAFESQYIATFDVGQPQPPVPLIESHYNKTEPVTRVLHENVLFYKRFGLRLRPDFAETSDHLLCQLSFAVHLLGLLRQREEADEVEEGAQIVQALGDYSDRHLRSWVPKAIAASEDAPLRAARPILSLISELANRCGSLRDA